jgi:CRISPR/Cas system-associated endonuclease Cas3-HD
VCYAYRKPGCTEEALADHLRAVSRCVVERWELKAIELKAARLLNVDPLEARELVIVAAQLHDIGKAVEHLQARCSEDCSSFPCHYMYSAATVGELIKQALGVKAGELEEALRAVLDPGARRLRLSVRVVAATTIVLLPILLHHIHIKDCIWQCAHKPF